MLNLIMYGKMLKDRYLSQKAQGMVEYALIIAFVIVIAAALSSDGGLKDAITGVFSNAGDKMNTANTATATNNSSP